MMEKKELGDKEEKNDDNAYPGSVDKTSKKKESVCSSSQLNNEAVTDPLFV
jgi:hypothetical protein